jgi:teichuronic acid biosynthesis glycosyltransferase TuaG
MISILLPLYNGIEYLNDSLSSIKSQTYNKWELIIGINGHYNNKEFYNNVKHLVDKIFDKNDEVKILDLNLFNKIDTLNYLTKIAKYNYISLIDADDIWSENKLELQIPYLDNYDIVGTHCYYINKDGYRLSFFPSLPSGDLKNHNFFDGNPIINSSVILKKTDAYWQLDNINLNGVEDYDLWFKLKFQKKKFYNIDKKICFHRLHDKSSFNNKNNNYVDILKSKWQNIFNLVDY